MRRSEENKSAPAVLSVEGATLGPSFAEQGYSFEEALAKRTETLSPAQGTTVTVSERLGEMLSPDVSR